MTHPEVPQATAREEAIAILAALIEVGGSPLMTFEQEAAIMLDALLAPRRVKCTTCEGTERVQKPYVGSPHATWFVKCPDCEDGFMTVPSLAILRADLEQVAWHDPTVHNDGKGKTTFGEIQCLRFAEEAESENDVPLYRIASEENA